MIIHHPRNSDRDLCSLLVILVSKLVDKTTSAIKKYRRQTGGIKCKNCSFYELHVKKAGE